MAVRTCQRLKNMSENALDHWAELALTQLPVVAEDHGEANADAILEKRLAGKFSFPTRVDRDSFVVL